MRHLRRAAIILLGLCLLPLASVLISTSLAALLGCELSETGTAACVVLGADLGGVLSLLFTLGWTALITLPLSAFVLLAWGSVELWSIWRSRRRARKAERHSNV